MVHYGQGKYKAAIDGFTTALAIRRRILGDNHPKVAGSLNNLGIALAREGRYGEARSAYTEAIAIQSKAFGDNHPLLAETLLSLGDISVKQGEFASARTYLNRAFDIIRTHHGDDHPEMATPLMTLGELALAEGRPDQAISLLKRALAKGNRTLEADIEFALAKARWARGHGDDHSQARVHAENARTRYRDQRNQIRADDVTTWLADHPL